MTLILPWKRANYFGQYECTHIDQNRTVAGEVEHRVIEQAFQHTSNAKMSKNIKNHSIHQKNNQQCDFNKFHKSKLQQHMRIIHESIKECFCKECGYKSTYKSYFKNTWNPHIHI